MYSANSRLVSVFPFPRPHSCGSLRHWVCPFIVQKKFLNPNTKLTFIHKGKGHLIRERTLKAYGVMLSIIGKQSEIRVKDLDTKFYTKRCYHLICSCKN